MYLASLAKYTSSFLGLVDFVQTKEGRTETGFNLEKKGILLR